MSFYSFHRSPLAMLLNNTLCRLLVCRAGIISVSPFLWTGFTGPAGKHTELNMQSGNLQKRTEKQERVTKEGKDSRQT